MGGHCNRALTAKYLSGSVWIISALTLATSCGGSSTQPPPPPPPPVTATETVLYSFQGGNNGGNDGYAPLGGLLKDSAGNLYGTTMAGGTGGSGTVFKLSNSGNEVILYSFLQRFDPANDGLGPEGPLMMDGAGNLFGTTSNGGDYTDCSAFLGCGTVFKLDTANNETVLYRFTGQTGDGALPSAGGGVIADGMGNLFGTTVSGGPGNGGPGCWCGTVFKVDSAGNETVLYSFVGPPGDGFNPVGNVIRDSAGNLYGATATGGSGSCFNGQGCGTVFKLDSAGHETILHNFTGAPDGSGAGGTLLLDNTGNLYGTTPTGGSSTNCQSGCGTIFKIDSAGHETVLYSFTGLQNHDGIGPGGLVLDSSGNLYGVTTAGGSSANCPFTGVSGPGCGTFFKLDTSGHEAVLYSFQGQPLADGEQPTNLITDGAGNFFGTTQFGGVACSGSGNSFGCGTVFKITLH